MPVVTRKPLDLDASLVARRAFWCNGILHQPGDSFDWRGRAVTERLVRQLHEDWTIDVVGSETAPELVEPPTPPMEPDVVTATTDDTPSELVELPSSADEPALRGGRRRR